MLAGLNNRYLSPAQKEESCKNGGDKEQKSRVLTFVYALKCYLSNLEQERIIDTSCFSYQYGTKD